ncbi:restriction endonuclease subunit S [Methylosinus sp. Sm6]|nr:restriction endonuclease subunit S [Methylosinus sp. Sm6]
MKGTIGRVGIVPDHFEGNIAREIARLRIKNEEYPRFVMCQLEGNHTQRRINDAVVGTTRLEFSISAVRKFAIAMPSSQAERKEIACALSEIEDLTSALSHLIAKKRDLRQGAMQRLLTGQTRLPGFTAPWQEKRLGALGRFMKGSGVRRDEAQSGDIPCVRYGEIYTTHQNVVRHFASYISRAVAHSATRIQRGDILFAASGETKEEIGKCVALAHDVEAYAGGDIIILRPTSGDPVFLGYLLNTPHVVRQKANKGQGDAVVHIGALALAAIEISVPDENEQAAIAGVLSDMDAEISALETRFDKTLALKQAMMQALLTGRVRLPVRRDEAPHTKEAAHA